MNNLPYTFAIIGGGLTATSMLCQLIDKLSDMGEAGLQLCKRLSVSVFEKKGVIGPGLPHNEEYVLPFHITNMCAKDMTVRFNKPGDFQEWVLQNLEYLEKNFPGITSALSCIGHGTEMCCHYPRAVMGEYLKNRFDEAVEAGKKMGITVDLHINYEVTDLTYASEHICLSISRNNSESSETYYADGALLATGHWSEPATVENYFSSPWPAVGLLAAIPPGEKVGVLGSSLSAIEVALTLTSDGQFTRNSSGELSFVPSTTPRKITFYSRNGLLPRVRGRIGSHQNRYFTCEAIRRLITEKPSQLTLSPVFELLDRELTEAYGFPTDWQQLKHFSGDELQLLQDIETAKKGDGPEGELIWQTILVQIFPVVRQLYLNLTLAERERFDRYFSTLFFMHAATQPVVNGEKLLALMQAGIVTIVKLGSDYQFEHDSGTKQFTFNYTGQQGDFCKDHYNYVINARGQSRSIESDSSKLTQNLLKKGLVQIVEKKVFETAPPFSYSTGSIQVNPENHQVICPNADDLRHPNFPVYVVGAMTRGQMIDTSMAYGLAKSTATVADNVIARLRGENIVSS